MEMNMRHVIFRPIGLGVFVMILCGCYNVAKNAPSSSKLWGGYASGNEYVLLIDCFMASVSDGLDGRRLALLPPGEIWDPSQIHSCTKNISSWQQSPTYEYTDIVGVVASGTVVRCSRLRVNRGWQWWCGSYRTATVYASVMNGEHSGKEVDMTDMSVYGAIERDPNPAVLKLRSEIPKEISTIPQQSVPGYPPQGVGSPEP